MKHSIISKINIDSHNFLVTVQLKPENRTEINAIKNVGNVSASNEEKEMIEHYLNFRLGLGNYSIIKLISQKGNDLIVQIFK